MNFRARLSLFAFEPRENPSTTYLDPITGLTVTIEDPPAPPPSDPGIISVITDAGAAGAGGVAGAGDATGITTTNDPLLGTNSVYNVPLLP